LTEMKERAEEEVGRMREENERIRLHYEVLKEHEVKLIREYEGKIQREKIVGE